MLSYKSFFRYVGAILLVVGALAVPLFVPSAPVAAVECGGQELQEGQSCCGGVPTSFDFNCSENADATSGNLERNPLYSVLLFITNALAVVVGIAAVGFIVWGGIIYATAGGNSEQVKRAISYITNAVIGIILYMSMYAILNFLIPGGIFN